MSKIQIGARVSVKASRLAAGADVPEVMVVTDVTVNTSVTPPIVQVICDNSYTFEADNLLVIDNTPVTHLVSINRINRTEVYFITIAPHRTEQEQLLLLDQLSRLFLVRVKQISVTSVTAITNITSGTDGLSITK